MSSSYRVLGQVNPAATTNTTLYTVPASTSAVTSTISICNTGGTPVTVNVAVRPAGASLLTKHYILYDALINASNTMFLTIGMTLATTDVVTVYTSTADVSFNLFGSEIT